MLKESALAHNLEWMADFTRATGVLLAPHGKTTMAPQLFARQIAAGAWGITFATIQQASLGVRSGVRRIILANQLVGREDIAHALHLNATIPDLELHVLVDSIAQLRLIEARATEHGGARPLNALLEMGIAGGRAGCRSADEAMAVARAVAASRIVRLSGVESFEGLNVSGDSEADRIVVERWMHAMQQVAKQCDAEGLFGTEEVTLSAGGSAVFDLVARGLPLPLSRPVRTILRSGCYVTHDSGFYERFLRRVLERSGAAARRARRAQARPGNLERGAVATGARTRDPCVRQARCVVRSRFADAVRPRARRGAHAARRRVAHRQAQRPAYSSSPAQRTRSEQTSPPAETSAPPKSPSTRRSNPRRKSINGYLGRVEMLRELAA